MIEYECTLSHRDSVMGLKDMFSSSKELAEERRRMEEERKQWEIEKQRLETQNQLLQGQIKTLQSVNNGNNSSEMDDSRLARYWVLHNFALDLQNNEIAEMFVENKEGTIPNSKKTKISDNAIKKAFKLYQPVLEKAAYGKLACDFAEKIHKFFGKDFDNALENINENPASFLEFVLSMGVCCQEFAKFIHNKSTGAGYYPALEDLLNNFDGKTKEYEYHYYGKSNKIVDGLYDLLGGISAALESKYGKGLDLKKIRMIISEYNLTNSSRETLDQEYIANILATQKQKD